MEQLRRENDTRRKQPNPGGGNQKLTGKRKATAQPDEQQAARKAAPKPQGRFGNAKYSKEDLDKKRRGNCKG